MNGCMCAIDIGGIGFGQVWTITLASNEMKRDGTNQVQPLRVICPVIYIGTKNRNNISANRSDILHLHSAISHV